MEDVEKTGLTFCNKFLRKQQLTVWSAWNIHELPTVDD
jgi:hypothetical protein